MYLNINIISFFVVNNDKINLAVQLAEQYHHFPALTQVSEIQKNPNMLLQYFTLFKEHGFSDYMFHYYLDNSK